MSYYAFLSEMSESDWLITPNQRLRVFLENQHHQTQLDLGKKAWPAMSITTLQRLQNQLFSAWRAKENSSLRLLNPSQSKRLWQDVIHSSEQAALLFKSKSTSEEAYAAWNLLKQWQLPITGAEFLSAKEYRIFLEWVALYQQQLKKHQAIDEAMLLELLCTQSLDFFFDDNAYMHVVGFLEYTPLQQHFFQHLPITIIYHDLPNEIQISTPPQKFAFATTEEEIKHMASWARALSQQQPNARIGCIIPKLESMQHEVKATFQQAFNEPSDISSQFNISAGRALSDHTVIEHSIALLKLFTQPFFIDDFKKTVSSVFFGNWQLDKNQRLHFHKRIPPLRHRTFTFDSLFHLPYFQDKNSVPECYMELKTIFDELQKEKKRSHRQWSQWFFHLLRAMKWPGDQSLSSYDYQLVSLWIQTITDSHQYDYKQSDISLNRFHQTLLSSAQTTIFHPQTPDSRVHILGTLEAIALPFDYTWIAMMNSSIFPAKIKPNAFIPKSIQKQHHLPHASANRELEYNRKLLHHVQAFTSQLTYSYAAQDNDQPQQQSGFIRALDTMETSALPNNPEQENESVVFSSKKIAFFVDDAVPLSPLEPITQGTYLFKAQVQCAFKAFNELRLNVQPEPDEPLGIDNRIRGRILHDALEFIWNTIKKQSVLKEMSESSLNELFSSALEWAFKNNKMAGVHEKNYLLLEKKRHHYLLKKWFELEKTRDAFSVMEVEKEFCFELGQQTFTFRCDRIDRLDDDTEIVIDYKNSEYYSLSDCFSEVLHEPQLPLYALALQDRIQGIAFAQITAKENKLNGVTANKQADFYDIKTYRYGAQSSWHQQLQLWKTQLTELLVQFQQGNVIANPSKGLKTCTLCKQQALCRNFDL